MSNQQVSKDREGGNGVLIHDNTCRVPCRQQQPPLTSLSEDWYMHRKTKSCCSNRDISGFNNRVRAMMPMFWRPWQINQQPALLSFAGNIYQRREGEDLCSEIKLVNTKTSKNPFAHSFSFQSLWTIQPLRNL